jgi:hypothetical protein
MRRLLAIAALSALISTCAGCDDTTTTSPSGSSTPTTAPISFGGLSGGTVGGMVIDRLVIGLSNPAGPCSTCANQMAIDNIVVTR